jgi:hypothetical protein
VRVRIRFPHAVSDPDPIVELAAVPRAGEAIETISGTYLVSQVVWSPFEIQPPAGADVCLELRRP